MIPKIWPAVALLAVSSCSVVAQEITLADRLKTASEEFNLTSPDLKPWHLKLDVTLFDEQGKHPTNGTIEAWQSGGDSRSTFVFGDSVYSRLTHSGKDYVATAGPELPYRATEVLRQVLHSGPSIDDIEHSRPEMRKRTAAKVALDCIMLSQPIPRVAFAPLGLFPTYCFLPGTTRLVVGFEIADEATSYPNLGKFLNQYVPMKMEVQSGETTVATAQVTQLSTYVPQAREFDPTPNMKEGGIVLVASDSIAATVLKRVQPIYPATARGKHATGTVVSTPLSVVTAACTLFVRSVSQTRILPLLRSSPFASGPSSPTC